MMVRRQAAHDRARSLTLPRVAELEGADAGKRRALALLTSAVFLVIAPGTVAGLVPWWMTRWRAEPPILGFAPGRAFGLFLLVVGAIGLLDSVRRFAVEGLGTPAPILPTRHLVVSGLYRFVRNPMYCAVVSAILGQALILGSDRLLGYAGIVWLAFHLFVLLYEEPTLRSTHAGQYDRYCANVPRWIPRLRPGWG